MNSVLKPRKDSAILLQVELCYAEIIRHFDLLVSRVVCGVNTVGPRLFATDPCKFTDVEFLTFCLNRLVCTEAWLFGTYGEACDRKLPVGFGVEYVPELVVVKQFWLRHR